MMKKDNLYRSLEILIYSWLEIRRDNEIGSDRGGKHKWNYDSGKTVFEIEIGYFSSFCAVDGFVHIHCDRRVLCHWRLLPSYCAQMFPLISVIKDLSILILILLFFYFSRNVECSRGLKTSFWKNPIKIGNFVKHAVLFHFVSM